MKMKDNTEERLDKMEITIQEKIAYLAGIVDGEGCICMTRGFSSRKASGPTFKIRLTICSTSLVLLDWLVVNFGGNYTKKALKIGMENKHSKSYNWNIHCDKAGQIIEMVLPYLVIKKRQAELVLAYRKIQKLGIKTCPGVSIVPMALRDEIFENLKFLNRRGPESVETNTPNLSEVLRKIESELVRNSEREASDVLSVKRDQFIFKN